MHASSILLDPWPRAAEAIFDPAQYGRLEALGTIRACDSRNRPDEFEALLPEAAAIIGQPDLPAERLALAPALRAVINVEGNFFPNLDYDHCFDSGIAVLSIAPAFAVPVAEMALGLALDLARGISPADASMRRGDEVYGSRGNAGAVLLSRSRIGIIGFGAIGRAIHKLLSGFSSEISVYDPWLPAGTIREAGCTPVDLETLLTQSDLIFVAAAVTSDNLHLLGQRELELLQSSSLLVLVSRAGVVDFDVMRELVDAGRFRAATDVFPVEPLPADDPIRRSRLLLSPHRAGGMRAALSTAAEMILDDLDLVLRGLPPVRLLPARRETIGRLRSKPASYR